MPSTLCECGHWDYDHGDTKDECIVSDCECKQFEEQIPEVTVLNPDEEKLSYSEKRDDDEAEMVRRKGSFESDDSRDK